LFWLGRATFEQGRYTEAEALWRELIEARHEQNADKGVVYAYFWLARALFQQERYAEAETLWRKEIKLQRKLQVDIREETLDSSFWLAKAIFKQRRYEEAEILWRAECRDRPYHREPMIPLYRPPFVLNITYRHLTIISIVTAFAASLLAVYAVIFTPSPVSLSTSFVIYS
jgi:tetratricopeptide (TPR) repeat protein